MGIQGLSKLIADNAPATIKLQKFENFFGRKIAIDASMCMYQFLVAVGRVGDQLLTNEAGETTSHIQGLFYRTSRMLQAGIKPVFVFDGKPPQLKRAELDRRFTRREGADEDLKAAIAEGDQDTIAKFSKRTVKVTPQHNEECKKLLTLMGVPYVEAPSEAEAQCCSMCREGLVYAVATDDMDALTFGTPKLIRNLAAPSTQKEITEYDQATMLEGMGLTQLRAAMQDQFIDMSILCGCDYCGTIRGIGPKRAYSLVKEHGSLEKVLQSLDKTKYPLPDPFPFEEVRTLFKQPEVKSGSELGTLTWTAPNLEALLEWLVHDKQFSEDRVRTQVDKMKAARSKSQQNRMESFFKVIPSNKPAPKKPDAKAGTKKPDNKRKAEASKGGSAAKKGAATKAK